jgi:two-component system, OmpR family, response regulator ResD
MNDISQRKIIIVEDEADLRGLYKEILEDAGYTIVEAATGIEALEKIKSEDWGLLLLDIMLPGRDGIRILRDIMETPALKKGPILALTNLNSDQVIKEAFSLGADGYLIKSEITPDRVVQEVRSFIK